ncbi:DUF2142 domain-containing protein [Enterococcus sp. AZ109]|uniref:DUF2142 domain-containing protein n=1 Tax=Enterococcus sp. AZ109 TaxID=2774634 RepID=UPI003F23D929
MRINKIENIFALMATLFIGIAIIVMPINRVPDEMNHARMAWGIVYEETADSFKWMDSVSSDSLIDKKEYKELFTKKEDFQHENFKLQFGLKNIMHLPQLFGMLLGRIIYPSIGVMVTLGRMFNALFYVIGMYFILKKMRYGRLPLFGISLLPIMIQQAASLSYDVANYLAITGFFAFLTQLSMNRVLTKTKLIQLLLWAIALYATKVNNLMLLMLPLLLNLRLDETHKRLNTFLDDLTSWFVKRKFQLIGAGIVGVIIILVVVGQFFDIVHFTRVMINTIFFNNLNSHLNTILTIGMFGYFGNFAIQMPLWLIFLDVALLALLFSLKVDVELNKYFGLLSGLMVPLQISAIIAGMYIAWTPLVLGENANISVGAQGRYFTPFLIFFVPLFVSFSDKLNLSYKKTFIEGLTIGMCVLNFLIMLLLVIPFYW